MGQHQGGFANLVNHPGNGVGFTGAGGPQQGLVAVLVLQKATQRCDRLGLIPLGFKGSLNIEISHGPFALPFDFSMMTDFLRYDPGTPLTKTPRLGLIG